MLRRFPVFKLAGARSKYRLDPKSQTIGILTAGGNAPGLNTVIDSVVKRHSLLATMVGVPGNRRGSARGLRIWGYEGGYVGLIEDKKLELNVHLTDKVSLQAGSLLKVQRGETPKDKQAQDRIAREMAKAVARDRLDILYVVGGNGTITAADQMCRYLAAVKGQHRKPVRVVAAPKTMDNDVHFTDVTFGFRTTVENAVEVIKRIHLEAETCGRIAVVELFGAGSGFVALHASYASGEVDYVLIPEMMQGSLAEKKKELDRAVARLAARFKKKGHAILVVAEGATTLASDLGGFIQGEQGAKQDAFAQLMNRLQQGLKKHFPSNQPPQFFTSQPRHLIRSTPPNSFDVDLCKQTGKLMVDTALAGMSRCVVSLWKNQFVLVPMKLATTGTKCVDVGGYYFLSMMEKYLL
jgi:6-phosphofructokinase 1